MTDNEAVHSRQREFADKMDGQATDRRSDKD